LGSTFKDVPFGQPNESLAGSEALGFRVPLYGIDNWGKAFTPRQLNALGTLVKGITAAREAAKVTYDEIWIEAIAAYLACAASRTTDYLAALCVWEHGAEEVKHVFMRWALPMTWDFAEG